MGDDRAVDQVHGRKSANLPARDPELGGINVPRVIGCDYFGASVHDNGGNVVGAAEVGLGPSRWMKLGFQSRLS